LRPAREKTFGNWRLLSVCGLFGVFYGMCVNAIFAMAHAVSGRFTAPLYAAPLFFTVTAFACGQLFASAWNRRAGQLNRRLAWVEANQRALPRS
jgi:hypothetical protein